MAIRPLNPVLSKSNQFIGSIWFTVKNGCKRFKPLAAG